MACNNEIAIRRFRPSVVVRAVRRSTAGIRVEQSPGTTTQGRHLSLDRLPADELVMTQELIANMLGVRREGVTEAAGNVQRAGLIEYQRGSITVLNRAGLEARSLQAFRIGQAGASGPPSRLPTVVEV